MFRTLAAILIAAPALAAPADALIQRSCGIETMVQARAACIGLLADTRLLGIQARLARAARGVQGASGPTLAAFERRLAELDRTWQADLRATCTERDPVGRQTCRLSRVLAREAQIETVLETAFAPLGGAGATTSPLPRQLYLDVPLTVPGFGVLTGKIPVPLPPP